MYIEEGKLFTKYFFKNNSKLTDYRSILDKKTKINTLRNLAQSVVMVCDKRDDRDESLNTLKKIAHKACYPANVMNRVMQEIKKVNEEKDIHLWNVNWRIVKREIEKQWDTDIVYIKRKRVPADGWCMLYALLGDLKSEEMTKHINLFRIEAKKDSGLL